MGNRLDETRAAQEFTSVEVNLQAQEIALVKAREALGVLVAGDVPVDALEPWQPGQMPALHEAMKEAETVRADVLARNRATEAADRTVHHAWADYLP